MVLSLESLPDLQDTNFITIDDVTIIALQMGLKRAEEKARGSEFIN